MVMNQGPRFAAALAGVTAAEPRAFLEEATRRPDRARRSGPARAWRERQPFLILRIVSGDVPMLTRLLALEGGRHRRG